MPSALGGIDVVIFHGGNALYEWGSPNLLQRGSSSPPTKPKLSALPDSLSVSQCFQSLLLAKTDVTGRHRGPILFLSNDRDRLFGGVS